MAAGRRAFPELPQRVVGVSIELLIDLMIRSINLLRDEAIPELLRVDTSLTINARHRAVVVDTSAGPVTLTLPKGLGDGRPLLIKDAGDAATNNITVAGDTGVTIDGSASITISTDNDWRSYVYDANRAMWMRVG